MKFIGKNISRIVGFALIIALWANLFTPIIAATDSNFNFHAYKDVFAPTSGARQVFIGGFPIGLSIKPEGIIVASVVPIKTCAGNVTQNANIESGDIIAEANGKKILDISDLMDLVNGCGAQTEKITLGILRNDSNIKIDANLIKEELTGQYKLGLAVKENVLGVGTVTFVKPDASFACLGHPITSGSGGKILQCYSGLVYDCRIVGYNRGQRGNPGELKGTFTSAIPCGKLYKNNKFGAYGKLDNLVKDLQLYEVADHRSVSVGKARIFTTIDSKPEFFDIEIIKAMQQNSPNDRSMVLRVTDKRLIGLTGGILQGMSGSPIIQNNKIVGAVTHVFVNDPTKGYGIYADWMYDM